MNYWISELTGLSNVTLPLFNYFEVRLLPIPQKTNSASYLLQKNWAPRGAETAKVLYNISRGWVTHNEVSSGSVKFQYTAIPFLFGDRLFR